MRDCQCFTLSDGTLFTVDFANAYKHLRSIARTNGVRKWSPDKAMLYIRQLLRLTPDMLIRDTQMVLEAWGDYAQARQIEEALING